MQLTARAFMEAYFVIVSEVDIIPTLTDTTYGRIFVGHNYSVMCYKSHLRFQKFAKFRKRQTAANFYDANLSRICLSKLNVIISISF